MKTIITYDEFEILESENGKYFVIDEIGTTEIVLIKELSYNEYRTKSTIELIEIGFDYDFGGETNDLSRYMYFKIIDGMKQDIENYLRYIFKDKSFPEKLINEIEQHILECADSNYNNDDILIALRTVVLEKFE
jgi:hypothetical protein